MIKKPREMKKKHTLAPSIHFTTSFPLFLPSKGNFGAAVFSFPLS